MKSWEASVLREKCVTLKSTFMHELKEHFQTQDHVPKVWNNISVIKWQRRTYCTYWHVIVIRIFPWKYLPGAKVKSSTVRQNLNYSTNKSALFACLFVLLLSLSLKRFVTPWELKKPNQAISGIPVSSQLIAVRWDFSLRIQLLSSGKNLQGSNITK